MADLKAMCVEIGFQNVETYIASGNVVFHSPVSIQESRSLLEQRLAVFFGKPTGVILRTADDLERVLHVNPYADLAPNKVHVLFLDMPVSPSLLTAVRHQKDEMLHLGEREVFIAYPNGMGQSRLVIDTARTGTARNINTVRTLAQMAKA